MLRKILKARRVLAQEFYDTAVHAGNQKHVEQLRKTLDKFDRYIELTAHRIDKQTENEIRSWLGK